MRKHIFTLGLLLSSFCIMPTMADEWAWNGGVVEASNVFYDENLSDHAKMHCATCCGSTGSNNSKLEYDPATGRDKINNDGTGGTCWLPQLASGQKYYMRDTNNVGTVGVKQIFGIDNCDTTERFDYYQICISDVTYSNNNSGRCRAQCDRSNGTYDIGIDTCVDKNWIGYLPSFDSSNLTWGVTMNRSNSQASGSPVSPFIVKGVATCASPTTNFSYSLGAYRASLDAGVKNGKYCFCRMTSVEFSSYRLDSRTRNMQSVQIEHGSNDTGWVAVKDYSSNPANCGTSCASDCASAVKESPTVRETMYEYYDH